MTDDNTDRKNYLDCLAPLTCAWTIGCMTALCRLLALGSVEILTIGMGSVAAGDRNVLAMLGVFDPPLISVLLIRPALKLIAGEVQRDEGCACWRGWMCRNACASMSEVLSLSLSLVTTSRWKSRCMWISLADVVGAVVGRLELLPVLTWCAAGV